MSSSLISFTMCYLSIDFINSLSQRFPVKRRLHLLKNSPHEHWTPSDDPGTTCFFLKKIDYKFGSQFCGYFGTFLSLSLLLFCFNTDSGKTQEKHIILEFKLLRRFCGFYYLMVWSP